jgi:hypothetical protein
MRALQAKTRAAAQPGGALLVRGCACGCQVQSAPGTGENCREKEALGLQAELIVAATDHPCEREADCAAAPQPRKPC